MKELMKEASLENPESLASLYKDLLTNSISLDPEISALVSKHFWDLLI